MIPNWIDKKIKKIK